MADKILFLFPDEDHQKEFDKIKGLKNALGDVVIKKSSFEQFTDDKKVDKFDYVIAFAI